MEIIIFLKKSQKLCRLESIKPFYQISQITSALTTQDLQSNLFIINTGTDTLEKFIHDTLSNLTRNSPKANKPDKHQQKIPYWKLFKIFSLI